MVEIRMRQQGDVLLADIAGRLDTSTAGAAYDTLVSLAGAKTSLVILNLSKLDYVSGSGLRAILMLAKLFQKSGGEMRICHVNRFIQEVIKASGFNNLINVYDDEKSAMMGIEPDLRARPLGEASRLPAAAE